MGRLRFRLLGEVCLGAADNDDYQTIRSTMPRALLATLLLDGPGRIVSAQRLIDTLWNLPPASAASNLRTYRTRLQRELDGARLIGRMMPGTRGGGGYGLRADASEVDVLVFRDLTARGRQHLQAGDYGSAAMLFSRAIALWRGPAGEDLPGTRRLVALTSGLNDERIVAVESLGRAAILSGAYREAISELNRHVAERPTRESAWVLLACAHYADGNAAVAQATIRRGYQALSDEVGLEPGADLKAAEEAAIRHYNCWFHQYLRRTA